MDLKKTIKLIACSTVAGSGMLQAHERRSGGRVSILMYHKVDTVTDDLGLTVSPELFEAQLQYLTKRHPVITLAEAVSRLEQGALDRHYVVITFDDGYRDNYTQAFPLLKKYKVPAIIFVTYEALENGTFAWHTMDTALRHTSADRLDLSGFGMGRISLRSDREKGDAIRLLHRNLKSIDETKRRTIMDSILCQTGQSDGDNRVMLNWLEVSEMLGSNLVEIGGHTMSHPILTRVTSEKALAEIALCKSRIEARTGRPVEFFAYPNGGPDDFNADIVEMVRGCGYRAAVTTIAGDNRRAGNLFSLNRTDVTCSMSTGIDGKFSPAFFGVKISGMLDGILFRD